MSALPDDVAFFASLGAGLLVAFVNYLVALYLDYRDTRQARAEAVALASQAEFDYLVAMQQAQSRGSASWQEAQARSLALLREWLTPAQRAQLDSINAFDVVGSGGNRYRICADSTTGNVLCLGAGGRISARLCVQPDGAAPRGDVLLAQKVMLENDEAAVLRVANFPVTGPGPSQVFDAAAWSEFVRTADIAPASAQVFDSSRPHILG